MMTPEIRRSELNAVRRLLTSVLDKDRTASPARVLRFEPSPLRARVARTRHSGRAATGTEMRPCTDTFF